MNDMIERMARAARIARLGFDDWKTTREAYRARDIMSMRAAWAVAAEPTEAPPADGSRK